MAGLNQFVSFLSSQQPAEGARVRRWVTRRQMVTLMTILVAAMMMAMMLGWPSQIPQYTHRRLLKSDVKARV